MSAGTAISLIQDAANAKLAIPAYLGGFVEQVGANITERVGVPSLSYEGKVWTIHLAGEKTKLTRNVDGIDEPISVLPVVVIDYAKRRGRAFYEGAYDPKKVAMPVCWSDDGIAPHENVKQKQAPECGKCPRSVKGSKITDGGKETTACGQHRMLAVVPANNLTYEPLRLKISITSDYDKQSPELEKQGWFAFSGYTKALQDKGITHTGMVVTTMRMDPNAVHPKVMFSAKRFLTAEEMEIMKTVVKDERIPGLLAGTYTPNGVDGEPVGKPAATAEDDDEGVVLPSSAPVAAPLTAPVEGAPAPKAAAAPKAPKAPKAAPKAAPVVDDDDIPLPGTANPPATAPKAAAAPAAVPVATGESSAQLSQILGSWDD